MEAADPAAAGALTRGWGLKSVRGWCSARTNEAGDKSSVGVGSSFIRKAPLVCHHVVTALIVESRHDARMATA
jgi:hypothetical protein